MLLCIEQHGALLIVLMHAAFQAVYSHNMLHLPWNVCGILNFDNFLSKKVS